MLEKSMPVDMSRKYDAHMLQTGVHPHIGKREKAYKEALR